MLVAAPTAALAAPAVAHAAHTTAQAAAATSPTGFNPVTARLVDTRIDGTQVPKGQVQGAVFVTLPSSVPTGTTAVLNVTALGAAGPGFVAVFPAGTTPAPTSSNVNYSAGTTQPDAVLVNTPADGRIVLNVGGAKADLVVDLTGYLPASAFTAVGPTRLADSRSNVGLPKGPLTGHETITLPSSVPSTAGLVALTLTATGAQHPGNIVAYPSGGTVPGTSNLNFSPGITQANLVLVKPAGGKVDLQISGGPTQVVVDLSGFTPAGSSVISLDPKRIADSRSGTGLPKGLVTGAVTITLPSSVPSTASAALINVTAASAVGSGFVVAYPGGSKQPGTSNVNYSKGHDDANLVLVPIGPNNTVSLFVGGAGAQLIVDLSGYVSQ
jgi:hypothetical protein